MPYTPTQWSTGDTITASALNKIEQGIASGGSGGVVVNLDETTGTIDKSFADLLPIFLSGGSVCLIRENHNGDDVEYYRYFLLTMDVYHSPYSDETSYAAEFWETKNEEQIYLTALSETDMLGFEND